MPLSLDQDFDRDLAPLITSLAQHGEPKVHDVQGRRALYSAAGSGAPVRQVPDAVGFKIFAIPRDDGSLLPVHHFRSQTRKDNSSTAAVIHFHGGGFIAMTPDIAKERLANYVLQTGVQAFSVDYRLAPEHRYPAALDDGWSTLAWIRENAQQLGINTGRIAVMGESAGGGLAAALAIRARDSGLSPPIARQILCSPMLDDRTAEDVPCDFNLWDVQDNITGWTAYLGKPPGGPDVPDTAAPARVRDVAGLPSLYMDTTQLELFVKESLEYARRFIEAGIEVELHLATSKFAACAMMTMAATADDFCSACHDLNPQGPLHERDVALSYCWGGDKNIRTLRANITAHMDSINLGHLPRCFQDVAVIAGRLGIGHLWVDSLCIIQDDQADWEDQFPRMSWVYRNATVVVAAASIGNCQESFLGNGDDDEMRRPASFIMSNAHPTQPAPVRARAVPTIGLHEDTHSFYSARDPLDNRAWPLQERFMATRILVYSRTELQWSCQTRQACEGGHTSSPTQPFTPLVSVDTIGKAYSLWHSQVMEFSKRRLAYETDKLPAISAIAGHVADVTGTRYIAGLWRDNLIRDMCWERHMFEGLKWEATATWRAPSFSWASVAGNVFYNEDSIAGKGACLALPAQRQRRGQ